MGFAMGGFRWFGFGFGFVAAGCGDCGLLFFFFLIVFFYFFNGGVDGRRG